MSRISLICMCFYLIFVSCEKQESRSCWKNRGEEVSKLVSIDAFHKMRLGRGIKFVLIQDSLNFVKIQTGRNLIDFINVEIRDHELSIENLNRCDFLRYGRNEVVAEIHFESVRNIYFEGSEPLTSQDTIRLDYLGLIVNESSSEINLMLSVDSMKIINPYAWPRIFLSGNCIDLGCEIDGDMQMNLHEFKVSNEFKLATSSSQFSQICLNGTHKFIGQISGTGDVGYVGMATQMITQQLSSGNFIPM